MSRRRNLAGLRADVLDALDDGQWRTPSEIGRMLDFGGGNSWYRLIAVVERLAADGELELQRPGATVRKFRRRARG